MLKRLTIIIIILSLSSLVRVKAQVMPQETVIIPLYISYEDPTINTSTVKRQPPVSLSVYLYNRILYMPEINEPYNVMIINAEDGNEAIRYDYICGAIQLTLPDYIHGQYTIELITNFVHYRGYIDLS